jgi:hypothetical protein
MKVKVIFGGNTEHVGLANAEATLNSVCEIGSYPRKDAEYTLNGGPANLQSIVKDGDTVTVDYTDAKLG